MIKPRFSQHTKAAFSMRQTEVGKETENKECLPANAPNAIYTIPEGILKLCAPAHPCIIAVSAL